MNSSWPLGLFMYTYSNQKIHQNYVFRIWRWSIKINKLSWCKSFRVTIVFYWDNAYFKSYSLRSVAEFHRKKWWEKWLFSFLFKCSKKLEENLLNIYKLFFSKFLDFFSFRSRNIILENVEEIKFLYYFSIV